jgi:hypothetical protein
VTEAVAVLVRRLAAILDELEETFGAEIASELRDVRRSLARLVRAGI